MQIILDEEVVEEQKKSGLYPKDEVVDTMYRAASFCLEREGFSDEEIERVEVSLSFVTKDEIQTINKDFREVDSVTDVLSFPQFEDLNDIPEEGEIVLGDVVICTERALEQADDFGHSPERELVYLFVHSMFHLLGYDHMTDEDKAEMREAEEDVMAKVDLVRE